jgi:hypothetical protein
MFSVACGVIGFWAFWDRKSKRSESSKVLKKKGKNNPHIIIFMYCATALNLPLSTVPPRG